MIRVAMLNQFLTRPDAVQSLPAASVVPGTAKIPLALQDKSIAMLPTNRLLPRRKGYKQVEQLTYVGTATVATTASTVVTLNHPLLTRDVTVTVPITNGQSASTIGGNVRTALNAALTTAEKAAVCTITGSTAVASATSALFLDDFADFTLSAVIYGATGIAVQQDAGVVGVAGETLTQGVRQVESITYGGTSDTIGSTIVTLNHPLLTRTIAVTVPVAGGAASATTVGDAVRAALAAAMTAVEKNIVTIGGTAGNVTATAVRAAADATGFTFTGTDPAGTMTYTADAGTAGVLGTVPDYVGQPFIADAVVWVATSDITNAWNQVN